MTVERVSQDALLKRVDAVGGEIKFLKRDLLRSLATRSQISEAKPSLFGSVRGGGCNRGYDRRSQARFVPLCG
jgi:hypothetical protein